MIDIYKQCNIKAPGCLNQYNLSERSKKQKGISQKKRKRYDACDNVKCQNYKDFAVEPPKEPRWWELEPELSSIE